MRIAILVTNTDDSTFAQAWPDDGEKFADLVHLARPDWHCEAFWVCRDAFPQDIRAFDGVMITGSPASVNDRAPWMLRLQDLIRGMIAARQPLFGACFGHQIIAAALGAPIVGNPEGWGHGLLNVRRSGASPWAGPETGFSLYGSHMEQVGAVPEGAEVVFEGPGCTVAGFALGDHLFTIQHHPEMTHDFMTALVEFYADEVGHDATERARASLAERADQRAFAEEIARFFEHAARGVLAAEAG
ncbi:GMP synthase [glutamine-hydrolyzing] [Sulfitobacter sp. THAF37]|uniref:type 1 glutamine amidotransferase n=1 Tax=Sulfitobacter sp. THAF37 TaxID=2587855 RepID=UPI0012689BEA|nr:type 1 glutamine amidotransferase [Sulfitobacter sp. THAF37]QFT59577.1 GMP synthase [glutamine-hydrolyzing] [Sulfitobacter sp. THAF37]